MKTQSNVNRFAALMTGVMLATTAVPMIPAEAYTKMSKLHLADAAGTTAEQPVAIKYNEQNLAWGSLYYITVTDPDAAYADVTVDAEVITNVIVRTVMHDSSIDSYEEREKESISESWTQELQDGKAVIRYKPKKGYLDSIRVTCTTYGDDNCETPVTSEKTQLDLDVATPEVETQRVYTGRLGPDGEELDSSSEKKPKSCELVFTEQPQYVFHRDEEWHIEDLRVALVEHYSCYDLYYDVSKYLTISGQPDFTQDKEYISLQTSYITPAGSGRRLWLQYSISIIDPEEESDYVDSHANVVTGIMTGTTPAVTTYGTVTHGGYYPDYNPWVTDAEGHTFNRGTNAYCGSTLLIKEYPRRQFLLGEPLDTRGIKAILTENRTHNQCDYDVSEYLDFETDYDPDRPGTYTVWVSTPYRNGELHCDDILSYTVEVLETAITGTTTTSKTYGTVTSGSYYPDYDPWFTDDEGHIRNRGTNAYQGSTLLIKEYPRRQFLLGEPLDTRGIKAILTEQRRFNQCDYDVSEYLDFETDYDPDHPGTYTVWISTPYKNGELHCDDVLSYTVEVLEAIYTGTTSDTSVTTTTTTTPTTSSTTETTTTSTTENTGSSGSSGTKPHVTVTYCDVNCDSEVDVRDAVMLARVVGGDVTATLTAEGRANADCNGNSKVDSDDLITMLRYLAKLIPADALGKQPVPSK